MATNVLDKVPRQEELKDDKTKEDTKELSKEVLNEEQLAEVKKLKEEIKEPNLEEASDKLKDADTDFYTRSMDLSDKDFEMDDEFKEKSLPVAVKVILIIVVLAAIAAAGYYIFLTYFK